MSEDMVILMSLLLDLNLHRCALELHNSLNGLYTTSGNAEQKDRSLFNQRRLSKHKIISVELFKYNFTYIHNTNK